MRIRTHSVLRSSPHGLVATSGWSSLSLSPRFRWLSEFQLSSQPTLASIESSDALRFLSSSVRSKGSGYLVPSAASRPATDTPHHHSGPFTLFSSPLAFIEVKPSHLLCPHHFSIKCAAQTFIEWRGISYWNAERAASHSLWLHRPRSTRILLSAALNLPAYRAVAREMASAATHKAGFRFLGQCRLPLLARTRGVAPVVPVVLR